MVLATQTPILHRGAPGMIWRGSGTPVHGYPTGTLREEGSPGAASPSVCATCAAPLEDTAAAVAVATVVSKTFADHADYLRFSSHLCDACAWLYSDAKKHHRNVLAVGEPGEERSPWSSWHPARRRYGRASRKPARRSPW